MITAARQTPPEIGQVARDQSPTLRHADASDASAEGRATPVEPLAVADRPEGSSDLGAAAAPHRGTIVTVFSPKGGAGKTTIATNLAVALYAGGARRVCLVDLDLEFGDVAITLRLEPNTTLRDGLALEANVDPAEALATAYRPGFDCFLAPIEPGESDRIPGAMVSALLERLRRRYDYVVLDTPSHFSEHVLAGLDASDHHVLVTNPEIPALKNVRLTLDMMDLLGYPVAARTLVYNKADPSAGLSDSEVAAVLHAPIAVEVPASRDVPASINKGVPLVEAEPNHPVSAAIRTFAARYIASGETGAAQPVGRRRRLFRKGTK